MAKPEPAFLQLARYPFRCEITTRFADTDVNQHINNVALAALIEESRVRFNDAARLAQSLGSHGAMVVNIAVDFLAQAYYPQPVLGLAGVAEIGRTSWTTVQLLVQDERIVVFGRSVLVCVRDGAPAPLPELVRAGFETMRLR
jgi:acyl-CoA thioester hydrolase